MALDRDLARAFSNSLANVWGKALATALARSPEKSQQPPKLPKPLDPLSP